jgi:hypothetical protein
VGELVDERDLRGAFEHAVDVEFLDGPAVVVEQAAGDGFEAVEQFGGVGATVRLDEADHDVGAALGPASGLFERGEGLADPRGRAEVDPQLST